MTRPFANKKSILWLIGLSLLIVGFLAFATIVPHRTATPGSGGPEVNLPSMQHVPPSHAPHMQLDTK